MIWDTSMDYDKIKIFGSKVRTDSMQKVAEIEEAEKGKMKKKVNKILAHKPDIFINRQLIYNYPEQLMADAGVMVIEHADFDGIERLSSVLGADILSTFDNPETSRLGTWGLVEQIMIGESKVIKFSGCGGKACSVVLRGSGSHVLDEAERSLHDALWVLTQTVINHKVVYGGGNSEISMSLAVEEVEKTCKGKEALAVEAFGRALRALPTIICDNGGYDSAEMVQNLRSEIASGNIEAGLDMENSGICSMKTMCVTECLKVKEQALHSAAEAAEMILRVDEIVRCAPRKREVE